MLKNYFKIAWRNLWLHRKISLINILGLTIGMAAAVLIMLWVQNELSFDSYHQDAGNIYRITSTLQVSKNESWTWETAPYLLGDMAKKQIPEVENITRIEPAGSFSALLFHYNGQIIAEKKCAYVDNEWFNMFRYEFTDGDAAGFVKNPQSLIITESTAKKYFGNREAVGQVIKVDTTDFQVQAVVKDNPANSSFQYDVYIPMASKFTNAHAKKEMVSWGNFNNLTFLKLQPGADIAKACVKMDTMISKARPGTSKTSVTLISLKDMHFETGLEFTQMEHGNRKLVNIFSIMAVLLLVTACINYVNLTTARASVRSKEVSVRKIVGAGRGQLFMQFISESFLLSTLALLFALVVVQVCLPGFNAITGKHFVHPLTNPGTWMLLIGTLFVCFLVNGIYPAVLLSSFKPLNIFRGKNVLSIKDTGLRRALVVLQFTISVTLIFGTIVIARQLNYMENVDLGYDKAHVFQMTIPWRILGFDDKKRNTMMNAITNELKAQSVISDVSLTNAETFYDNKQSSSGGFDWDGRPKDFNPGMCVLSVDDNFPKMMKLKIKEGHWFRPANADIHNIILNETAVQTLMLKEPLIGKVFRAQGDTGVIIGIAKDFHYKNLHEKIGPMIINNHVDYASTFYIKTTPGNTQAALAAAKGIWKQFDDQDPFDFSFLDDGYNALYKAEQTSSLLVAIFASIAILVSVMGLLGLVTFAAEQRIKEIGIRKVLGASIQNIVSLLSADFIKMVLVACVIAFPIAWWAMNKWLQDFAYKIDISWWIFALAGFIALLIALVTVSIQATKAAVANPVKSLRSE